MQHILAIHFCTLEIGSIDSITKSRCLLKCLRLPGDFESDGVIGLILAILLEGVETAGKAGLTFSSALDGLNGWSPPSCYVL